MVKSICDERLHYSALYISGYLITGTDLIGTVEDPVAGLYESCDSMKMKFIDKVRS
jgi:hypothetical protein